MIFLDGIVRKHGWPKITLLVLDWVALTFAAVSTFFIHYFTGIDDYDVKHSLGDYILRVSILYASFPVAILIFRHHLLYKLKIYSSGVMQFAQLSRALLINALLLIAVLFFIRQDWILHSRTNLLLFTITSLFWLSLFRIVLFRKLILPSISGSDLRRVLLVGLSEDARELLMQSLAGKTKPFEIVSVVDANGLLSNHSDVETLTTIPSLREYVPKHNIHEIIVAENDLPYEEVVSLIADAREAGVPLHLLSDHFKVVQERVSRSTSEFLNLKAAPVSHGLQGFYANYIKYALDALLASIGIIFLSPFLLVIASAIKLGSRGPLFYHTEVVGQNGKSFRWYKFRTMYMGKRDNSHRDHVSEHIRLGTRPTAKLENDPRVTPIGGWLRKHSLDELPQLWNVVIGNMSLVGPRPCLPYEYEQYAGWHKERFAVHPGMTGLWQVSGRSSVSFNDMVILDLYYIHNISIWLDWAIILRTIGVVLTGRGGG
ncbi:MAG TPA: exopolysaccharide biosynthesis polyprenyl glycosylphosphotransferase [Candidatus Kapabacteria bacterium]|jgi:undecaprenyl-phosphate galactose phosphotransferase